MLKLKLLFLFKVFIVLGVLPGAFCWPYVLNTWLVFIGKEAVIVWWQGALLGFVPFLGQCTILIAVITWLLMLFL